MPPQQVIIVILGGRDKRSLARPIQIAKMTRQVAAVIVAVPVVVPRLGLPAATEICFKAKAHVQIKKTTISASIAANHKDRQIREGISWNSAALRFSTRLPKPSA